MLCFVGAIENCRVLAARLMSPFELEPIPPRVPPPLSFVHAFIGCASETGVSIEPLLGCLEAIKLRETTKRDKARMALAQLARASPLQGEGRGFESLNAHQFSNVLESAQGHSLCSTNLQIDLACRDL